MFGRNQTSVSFLNKVRNIRDTYAKTMKPAVYYSSDEEIETFEDKKEKKLPESFEKLSFVEARVKPRSRTKGNEGKEPYFKKDPRFTPTGTEQVRFYDILVFKHTETRGKYYEGVKPDDIPEGEDPEEEGYLDPYFHQLKLNLEMSKFNISAPRYSQNDLPTIDEIVRQFILPQGNYYPHFSGHACLVTDRINAKKMTTVKELDFFPQIDSVQFIYLNVDELSDTFLQRSRTIPPEILCGYILDTRTEMQPDFLNMMFHLTFTKNNDGIKPGDEAIFLGDPESGLQESIDSDIIKQFAREHFDNAYNGDHPVEDFEYFEGVLTEYFIDQMGEGLSGRITMKGVFPTEQISVIALVSDYYEKKILEKYFEEVNAALVNNKFNPVRNNNRMGIYYWKFIESTKGHMSYDVLKPKVYVRMSVPLVLEVPVSMVELTEGFVQGNEGRDYYYPGATLKYKDKRSDDENQLFLILSVTSVMVPIEDLQSHLEIETRGNRKELTMLDLIMLSYVPDIQDLGGIKMVFYHGSVRPPKVTILEEDVITENQLLFYYHAGPLAPVRKLPESEMMYDPLTYPAVDDTVKESPQVVVDWLPEIYVHYGEMEQALTRRKSIYTQTRVLSYAEYRYAIDKAKTLQNLYDLEMVASKFLNVNEAMLEDLEDETWEKLWNPESFPKIVNFT